MNDKKQFVIIAIVIFLLGLLGGHYAIPKTDKDDGFQSTQDEFIQDQYRKGCRMICGHKGADVECEIGDDSPGLSFHIPTSIEQLRSITERLRYQRCKEEYGEWCNIKKPVGK